MTCRLCKEAGFVMFGFCYALGSRSVWRFASCLGVGAQPAAASHAERWSHSPLVSCCGPFL